MKPKIHQVLATLGYGDAIGHEVLGIQRVLQAAGYVSEIFVETADRRLEHLTLDYRDLHSGVMLVLLGLGSIPVSNFIADKDPVENAIEWVFCLLMSAFYLLTAVAWRRTSSS